MAVNCNLPDGIIADRRESGRMIFLAEPNSPVSFKGFLARWGVIVDEGYIRDVTRSGDTTPYTLQLSLFDLAQLPRELLPRV